ncbi:MAG: MATE family efflux transporter [Calditerrivibrio sp.]|nr:MATE family efflux transporter [Calditerrivibrio sp.]
MENKQIRIYLKNSWDNSWPIVLIMFFEFLIGITDVYIAGKLSKEIQGSLGFVSQIYFIMIVIANAFTMGVVSIASKMFTANRENFYRLVYTALISITVFAFVFSVLAFLLKDKILAIISPPATLKVYIEEFLYIYSFVVFFHYILIVTNGLLRSSKRVKLSLLTMFFVFMINVCSNILYVFYTPIGYKGLVFSTLTAVLVGFLINLYHLRRDMILIREYRVDFLKKAFGVGWPGGIVQIGWQTASVIMFSLMSKLQEPEVYIAAFTNGIRIESIIFLPSFAFSMANAVIVGNLIGEKRYEDAYRNSLFTSLLGCGIITIMTVFVVVNAEIITGFLSNDLRVMKESMRYLYISAISEPFMAIGTILIGGLNGAGDTKHTMLRIMGSLWGVRIPLAFILGVYAGFGAYGIWWAMTISIIVQAILIYNRFKTKRWLIYED